MKAEETARKIRENAIRCGSVFEKEIEPSLNTEIINLSEKLNGIVDNKAREYKLIRENNSSKEIKLYELEKRVKRRDSLIEKIIRTQNFSDAGSDAKKMIIEKIDDLMGLRFLVSLSCDCYSMFRLLKDADEELKAVGCSIVNNSDTKLSELLQAS